MLAPYIPMDDDFQLRTVSPAESMCFSLGSALELTPSSSTQTAPALPGAPLDIVSYDTVPQNTRTTKQDNSRWDFIYRETRFVDQICAANKHLTDEQINSY